VSKFFDTQIEFLKGVGPKKSELLNKELNIYTYGDFVQHYPFRYEDRTRFYTISEIKNLAIQDPELTPTVQIKGTIRNLATVGGRRAKRLIAHFSDTTGELELVWFKGLKWIAQKLYPGVEYVVFGKPTLYGKKINLVHPEIDPVTEKNQQNGYLQPVYPSTEKLNNRFLDGKAIGKLMRVLLEQALPRIKETLSPELVGSFQLITKSQALLHIHFPKDRSWLDKATYRLKFEELFYIQLRLIKLKISRTEKFRGQKFTNTSLLTAFYNNHLSFELTNAQKRVIKEIYDDVRSGRQMNRLLQGDVGSGKTIVAFICTLIAISGGAQAALMAPTEILAEQHFNGLSKYAHRLNLHIAKLTGSSTTSQRKQINQMLRNGDLNILVGTHALLEESVQFKNLGLAIIDEQHRFGVAQRAKLWQKNDEHNPHILVMTATPIPRTLAMTLYGDLDVSVIDELPAGRKPIKTVHRYDSNRLKVFGFIKNQINSGRQIYIVYPLIEESEKLDFKDLMDGYESITRAFPDIPISIVHGRMKSKDKDFEMQRFLKKETKIMVATTVIEVGVDVANATVMIIENSERFGLAQLHQLRGRVGRGADQSYCILMTKYQLSKDSRKRIETMVRTNNGFEIADVDLKLRGPGDLAGTQQSGVLDLLIADLSQDGALLKKAREAAIEILEKDPQLIHPDNQNIRQHIDSLRKNVINWSRVS